LHKNIKSSNKEHNKNDDIYALYSDNNSTSIEESEFHPHDDFPDFENSETNTDHKEQHIDEEIVHFSLTEDVDGEENNIQSSETPITDDEEYGDIQDSRLEVSCVNKIIDSKEGMSKVSAKSSNEDSKNILDISNASNSDNSICNEGFDHTKGNVDKLEENVDKTVEGNEKDIVEDFELKDGNVSETNGIDGAAPLQRNFLVFYLKAKVHFAGRFLIWTIYMLIERAHRIESNYIKAIYQKILLKNFCF
jgi:hypothetical protein